MRIHHFTFLIMTALFPLFSFAQESAPIPNEQFIWLLAAHIVFGLIGVGTLYMIAITLLKNEPNIRFVRWSALVSVVALITSWVAGGIYYVLYYGGPVKTAIKAGENPWAHNFFMEAKEHVFLLLPFIALTLMFVSWVGGGRALEDQRTRRAFLWLAIVGTAIGIFSTLSGVLISGSV